MIVSCSKYNQVVLNFAYIHDMQPKIVFKLFFLYLMLYIFYYSSVLYLVFKINTIIFVVQVY